MSSESDISYCPNQKISIGQRYDYGGSNTNGAKKTRSIERVYARLRNDLILQEFRLRQRLMINELADRYQVSITPVREALSRLLGEQLVGFQAGFGYFCKIPTLNEVQDLYRLLEALLCFAISQGNATPKSDKICQDFWVQLTSRKLLPLSTEESGEKGAKQLEIILLGIADFAFNEEISSTVENALARTHFVRKAVIGRPELDAQLHQLAQALNDSDSNEMQTIIHEYFDRESDNCHVLLRDLIALPYLSVKESD